MQLQTLRMEFFGPYRDETVDFASFDDTPLFLITGKTGSGKTTIFDALVFALYGDTSGDERSGDEMRANFATPAQKTRVTLRFHHNGHDYEIWREPAQALAKKRGKGTTASTMNQCLTVYTDGKESGQWTKKRDVAPRINDLLHLDADQFRQIILLPQGQFRQFLDANSDDKGKLLQRLFGTGIYARWQEAVKQAAKSAQAKVKHTSDQLTTLAGQFAYAKDHQPAAATLTDQLAAMKQTVIVMQADRQAAENALKQAEAAYEKANQAYQTGSQLQQAFAQQTAATAALAELAAAAPKRASQTARLAQLEWVAAHTADADRLAGQRAELTTLAQTLVRTTAALSAAQVKLAAAQQSQAALAAKAADVAAARTRLQQLAALRPQLERVAALQQAQALAQTQLQAATTRHKAAQTQADQIAAALKQNAVKIQQLMAADQEPAYQAQALRLAALKPVYEQWQEVTRDLDKAQHEAAAARTTVAKAAKAAAGAQAQYVKRHDAQLAAQIANLAGQLSPGAPCPVCGSTDHPHPAAGRTAASVSEEDVERADAERQTAQRRLAEAQATLDHVLANAAKLTTQRADLAAELAEDGAAAQAYQQLVDQVAQLKQAVAAQQSALARLQQEGDRLQQAQASAAPALQRAEAAAHQADTALSSAEAALATARQALPEAAPALSALTAEQHELQAQIEAYETAQTQNQAALSSAKEAVASAQATKAAQETQQTTLQTALGRAQADFTQALDEHLGTAANFAALRTQIDQVAPLKATLEAAKAQQTAQTALLKQATAQIGDAAAPDLAGLQQARERAAAAQRAAQAGTVDALRRLEQNQALMTQIEAAFSQNKAAQSKADALASLADVLNGNNDRKLSLERFVLRAYLQEVLRVANFRFSKLTAGRYQFQLHQEPGSYRNESGLEIDVYDDQVGATRSVHTLSGGESFIAALSLALALGEVIQREAGGIAIDALFVDEGFGSLDSASLHTAMEALETIEGQARMIGIISHVAELRATVPDQLQVNATGTGESHLHAVHADR
ncbi:AAA family ATPase [Lacticaseibacillus jixianensis]|uniref:Nuclease SbcCD subunit C n=1 Tax=Lacticaseibacillus jixianensis TaxID=2486012 RepID=A0ABW4B898_9LACO|nr:SMC family ATPase [Lacticaseibacillus jixianensis]